MNENTLAPSIGRIIELKKKTCLVDTGTAIIEAAHKGTHAKKQRPLVGDRVEISADADGGLYAIIKTLKRSKELMRPAIANIDQIGYVCTVSQPAVSLSTIDRYIFCAEANSIRCILVFNKVDLLSPEGRTELLERTAMYEKAGYTVLAVSAKSGEGIAALLSLCTEKITALAGPSGVGKSTVLGCLFPERQFRTSNLSIAIARGVNTTTATSLIKLPCGGYIADTPGFSALDLPPLSEEGVLACFPDLARYVGRCKFGNCTHTHEPGCCIAEKAENGEIPYSRLDSFHACYNEVYGNNRRY